LSNPARSAGVDDLLTRELQAAATDEARGEAKRGRHQDSDIEDAVQEAVLYAWARRRGVARLQLDTHARRRVRTGLRRRRDQWASPRPSGLFRLPASQAEKLCADL